MRTVLDASRAAVPELRRITKNRKETTIEISTIINTIGREALGNNKDISPWLGLDVLAGLFL